jgi:hypothetical protein
MKTSSKVILNTHVSVELRLYVKVTAAKEGMTMAAFLEKIILEWQKTHP